MGGQFTWNEKALRADKLVIEYRLERFLKLLTSARSVTKKKIF